jgi:hypothetical protein
MFSLEVTAMLRAVLDDVCADVAEHESSKKALVASKLLESASRGVLTVDALRAVGRQALQTPSMWGFGVTGKKRPMIFD